MMFCVNCGNKIDNDVEFCPSCGSKIHRMNQSILTKHAVPENISKWVSVFCHLCALIIPFWFIILLVPGIIWRLCKLEPFAKAHIKESFAFQITMGLMWVIISIFIGHIELEGLSSNRHIIIGMISYIFILRPSILGAISAYNHTEYTYSLSVMRIPWHYVWEIYKESQKRFLALPNDRKAICAIPLLLLVLGFYFVLGQRTANQFVGDWETDGGVLEIVRDGDIFSVHLKNRGSFGAIAGEYSGSIEKGKLVTNIPFFSVITLSADATTLYGVGTKWLKEP